VSTPINKENAPAGESAIRLDDLIPKENVVGGGRQLLFGATDITQTGNNPKQQG
jgi:hypothetical protein